MTMGQMGAGSRVRPRWDSCSSGVERVLSGGGIGVHVDVKTQGRSFLFFLQEAALVQLFGRRVPFQAGTAAA